jgi:hypothetical protein
MIFHLIREEVADLMSPPDPVTAAKKLAIIMEKSGVDETVAILGVRRVFNEYNGSALH